MFPFNISFRGWYIWNICICWWWCRSNCGVSIAFTWTMGISDWRKDK